MNIKAKPKQHRAKRAQFVNVRVITNPFEPLTSAVTEKWTWKKRKTLDMYLSGVLVHEHVVSVNGAIVEQGNFAKVLLRPNDYVVLCPILRGGGGFKSVFRMVALLAVAVAAPYAGAALAGTALGTAAAAAIGVSVTTMGSMIAAGIMVAGSFLVNALLPPPSASRQPVSSLANSTSYGYDGAKNTSNEGVATPLCYGAFQMAGNVIAVSTQDDGNNQILYMLLNAGEGPVAGIDTVQINGRNIAEYSNASYQVRLGYPQQGVMDWFSTNSNTINWGFQVSDIDWQTVTTKNKIQQFTIDFVCPNGLYYVNPNSAQMQDLAVGLLIQYRRVGTTEWTPLMAPETVAHTVYVSPAIDTGNAAPTGSEQYGYTASTSAWSVPAEATVIAGLNIRDPSNPNGPIDAGTIAQVNAQLSNLVGQAGSNWPVGGYGEIAVNVRAVAATSECSIVDNSRSAVRRQFTSPQLDFDYYEVQFKQDRGFSTYTLDHSGNWVGVGSRQTTDGNSMDTCVMSDLVETTFDGVSYINTALVGIRIQMNAQLSSIPSVTYRNNGKLVRVYSRNDGALQVTYAPSSNPAWILFDMATNARYGAGLADSRLDFQSVMDWAAYCDANKLTWNGIIDQQMTFWDAAQMVLRCGHAQMVAVGTTYRFVLEAPSDPVMMFGMGNIVQDTFKQTWLPLSDRANDMDITYFDATDYYKAKTVKVQDGEALLSGQNLRNSAITMYGVTDIQKAYLEGAFQLNLNRYITQTVEFQAPIEAIACTVGDVILVQHDQPAWAFSGRVDAGSTNQSVVLDRPVTMDGMSDYSLLLLSNAVSRGTFQMQNINGNFVGIRGGMILTTPMKRLQSNGVDRAVTAIVSDGVYVDSIDGLVNGASCEFFDTDVIEQMDVEAVSADGLTVTLSKPLSFVPAQFTNYMFGTTEKVTNPFRVKAITLGTSDFTRKITAVEYVEAVYDLSKYADQAGQLVVPTIDPSQALIGPVVSLTVYEETYVSGSQILSDVVANWSTPLAGVYAGADVYVSTNGGPLNLYQTVKSDTRCVISNTHRGDKLSVFVVAYDVYGKRASTSLSPTQAYTVVGQISAITVGGVTGADFYWSGRDCKITWNYNSVTGSFEFGSETAGADQGTRDPQFKDYRVQVFDRTGTILRRTEYTQDPTYTYTFDKNFADGPERYIQFQIAQRDVFNNIGKPAVLDAYNAPPTLQAVNTTSDYQSITVAYTHSDDPDFAGAVVWLSDTSPVQMVAANLVYDGPDSAILLSNLMFDHDYYLKIAPYDVFGETELIPSAEIHVHTPFLDVNAIAAGVLGADLLQQDLQSRIDLVDGTGAGSVSQRIQDAITTESAARTVAESALTASITNEQQARQTATDSLATSITQVSSRVDSNASAIQSEQQARSDADSSLGSRIDTVVATSASNTAAITTEQTARTTADSALGTRIDTLAATVGSNTGAIQTEQTARADADSALGQRIDSVLAAVGNNSASIASEQQARANGDSANAASITQLSTTVSGNTATIQQQATSINGLSAQYTVKIDNNGFVAGYGLASTTVNGTPTSEFAVRSDKFSVQLPGYAGVYPFTIGAVNGVPQTIISSALIGDASISSAKIGTAQVNTANITDAAITAAKIGFAQIQTAHIGQAQIDTLRIGANAVSTMASWSGGGISPVYTASGGPCLIIVDTLQITQALSQFYPTGLAIAIDGGHVKEVSLLQKSGTDQPWSSYGVALWQGVLSPGNHTIQCFSLYGGGSDWVQTKSGSITVFEAKR
ncbi:host specificity factor TipJ family phage tail protein [Burkholderia gladioli]|uniref:host specificity factor TipJ family phage tail protein n=1 Tax=Burkholderia gladioli TaxID=28095 RepID=UPI003B50B854